MADGKDIKRGCSTARDARLAAREFHAAVNQPGATGLVVFFCAPTYDLEVLASELRDLFGETEVIGCTTAGEIGPNGYTEESIVGFSFPADECCAATTMIGNLAGFQIASGHAAAEAVIETLTTRCGHSVDPAATFAMLLSDGMSTNQEALIASFQGRMANIPLLGGSAGDNLEHRETLVYHDGRFHSDAAVLALIRTSRPFRLYRCQHYDGSDVKMVVTQADPVTRVVSEINAEPAAVEYARVLGVTPAQLSNVRFAESPPLVRIRGDYYARSIQSVNEDNSLTFYCAIDEGVVLTLAHRMDMAKHLEGFFASVRADLGELSLVVGFDCVLRRLEAEERQIKHKISTILGANKVIGFNSYGEHFNAMHVTQTFTAVAFGGSAAS